MRARVLLIVLMACGSKPAPRSSPVSGERPPVSGERPPVDAKVNMDLRAAPVRSSTRLLAPGVGSATFTPDGMRVVYTSAAEGLVVVSPDGTNKRQLAPQANYFNISPDGQTIVYFTDTHHLYAVSILGDARVQLTAKPMVIQHAVVTPDGVSVAMAQAV